MCGRLTLYASGEELAEIYDLQSVPSIPPRYNVAPSQLIAVIGAKADNISRGLVAMTWGLVPHWANDPNGGPKPINAKSESVLMNVAFRDSARHRRCIIPANGFYEWMRSGSRKIPHYFTALDDKPFAFAGIYDAWQGDRGQTLHTCCILTTTANSAVSPLHDRMPVILYREDISLWLDRRTGAEAALKLCVSYAAEEMRTRIVSTYVNRATNEGEECIRADAA